MQNRVGVRRIESMISESSWKLRYELKLRSIRNLDFIKFRKKKKKYDLRMVIELEQ